MLVMNNPTIRLMKHLKLENVVNIDRRNTFGAVIVWGIQILGIYIGNILCIFEILISLSLILKSISQIQSMRDHCCIP